MLCASVSCQGRICSGGCGMHVKHGVKAPPSRAASGAFSSQLASVTCRLQLVFSGNWGAQENLLNTCYS